MKKYNSHEEKIYLMFNNIESYKLNKWQTNVSVIYQENVSSSVENISTYSHYLTHVGEF